MVCALLSLAGFFVACYFRCVLLFTSDPGSVMIFRTSPMDHLSVNLFKLPGGGCERGWAKHTCESTGLVQTSSHYLCVQMLALNISEYFMPTHGDRTH